MAIFTEETQKKILTAMQETTALTKIIANGWNVDSWKAVQTIVQSGAAPKYFPIGTQLNVASTQYGTLVFDVVAHDHHKNPNDASAHTMTLMQHYAFQRRVDNDEYLWGNTTGAELPAGTYHFTGYRCGFNDLASGYVEDGLFQFTTTQPIPAGGTFTQSQIGNYRGDASREAALSGTFTTYDASGNVIESGLATTDGSEGTDLGTCTSVRNEFIVNKVGAFNPTMRKSNGSNNWRESNIRQWLNSSATSNWFTKQTIFDVAPKDYYYPKYGYMADLDPEFVAVVGEVDNITNHNTVFEVDGILSGTYTTRDRFFLPSHAELGFASTYQSGAAEGSVLEFYDGATAADRIKYQQKNKAKIAEWWYRTPASNSVTAVGIVWGAGKQSFWHVVTDDWVAPACVIY